MYRTRDELEVGEKYYVMYFEWHYKLKCARMMTVAEVKFLGIIEENGEKKYDFEYDRKKLLYSTRESGIPNFHRRITTPKIKEYFFDTPEEARELYKNSTLYENYKNKQRIARKRWDDEICPCCGR